MSGTGTADTLFRRRRPATASSRSRPRTESTVTLAVVSDATTPGAEPEQVRLTIHEIVGGDGFFVRLVDEFYDRVAADPVLMAVYPDDLTEPRRTTAAFLAQFWGGEPHYSNERGHPRLRMRHHPFRIRTLERDAWFTHMTAALDVVLPVDDPDGQPPIVAASGLVAEVRAAMVDYFDRGATAMINSPDE